MKRDPRDEDAIVSAINVAPLVDVCLVLVIIFMVTAPMMADPVIKVDLPTARTREGEEREKVTVTLSKDGRVALDQKEYSSLDALVPDLRYRLDMSETKLVILRADEGARHGKLTEIMFKAKEAGAAQLTIATRQKK